MNANRMLALPTVLVLVVHVSVQSSVLPISFLRIVSVSAACDALRNMVQRAGRRCRNLALEVGTKQAAGQHFFDLPPTIYENVLLGKR